MMHMHPTVHPELRRGALGPLVGMLSAGVTAVLVPSVPCANNTGVVVAYRMGRLVSMRAS